MLDPSIVNGTSKDNCDRGSSTAKNNDVSDNLSIRTPLTSNVTYNVIMSWKSQTPRKEAATPLTADETMCVIGDVTLMESRLAIPMRKPNAPYEDRHISV